MFRASLAYEAIISGGAYWRMVDPEEKYETFMFRKIAKSFPEIDAVFTTKNKVCRLLQLMLDALYPNTENALVDYKDGVEAFKKLLNSEDSDLRKIKKLQKQLPFINEQLNKWF